MRLDAVMSTISARVSLGRRMGAPAAVALALGFKVAGFSTGSLHAGSSRSSRSTGTSSFLYLEYVFIQPDCARSLTILPGVLHIFTSRLEHDMRIRVLYLGLHAA